MGEVRDPAAELAEVARELRRHVRWAQGRGETQAPLAGPGASELPVAVEIPPVARPGGADGLSLVRTELGDCRRCKLCEGRSNLVFGAGDPHADLVFVGEGPGAEEDEQGEPFVGKPGQLLTRMIEAMGLRREQVYICNVVKCRPPGNRSPEPEEIAACEPFLQAQLAALRPKAIVALGEFAAQTLLREQTPITRLRGTWRVYEGIPLMPTFHPAYLLRSPAEKAKAWDDLKLVMARLGMEPPARR
ncbi:uracil-DNA glycosylase [Vulgatibacter sp.]|uniref:uracil-DNA glycosylase n=1 Tax=Vulgatibacter sp. TaxID=1971226 RepID=UPI003563CAB3